MANPSILYYFRVKYSEKSMQPEKFNNVQEEPGDVTSLTFVRNAISNTSSYSILTINIPIEYFTQLQYYISSGIFPHVQCQLEMIDSNKRSCSDHPTGNNILSKPIIDKEFKMIYIKELEKPNPEKRVIHCLIIMSDPLLHFLSTRLTFNKILKGTPFDYLTEYESYLNTQFPNVFTFHKFAEEDLKINHQYSQILLKPESDIQIPRMLINWYKVYNTPSLYFFDEFKFDKSTTSPINCYLFNIASVNSYNKVQNIRDLDAGGMDEYTITQNLETSYSMVDPNSKLLTPITNMHVYDFNAFHIGTNTPNEQNYCPDYEVEINTDKYFTDDIREISVIKQRESLVNKTEVQTSIDLYSPDTAKLANTRYIETREMYKNITSIEQYSFTNTAFELIIFGNRYNLNIIDGEDNEDREQYVYIPISIINTFHRTVGSEPILTHTSKVQFLKFLSSYKDEQPDYTQPTVTINKKAVQPANTNSDKLKEESSKVDDLLKSAKNIQCNKDILENKDGIKDKLRQYIKTKSEFGRNSHAPTEKQIDQIIEAAAKTENPHYTLATISKESHFLTNKNNAGLNSDGSVDYGLMQINVPKGANPAALYGKYGVKTVEDLYNPEINIRIGLDKMYSTPPKNRGRTQEARDFYNSLSDIEKNAVVYGGATTLDGMKFVKAYIAYSYQDLKQFIGTELKPDPSCLENNMYKGDISYMDLSEIKSNIQDWAVSHNKPNVHGPSSYTTRLS